MNQRCSKVYSVPDYYVWLLQGRTKVIRLLILSLVSLTGIKHHIASAYHPQTNGLDERLNQTVTKSLVKYINADQNVG